MNKYVLDADGNPQPCEDLMEWGLWFENASTVRVVGRTEVSDASVSTVFLGLDHSFTSGPPVLFETMIFGGEHDQWQARYCTRAEAEAGHAAVVDWLKGNAPEPEA